jgi:hypothetical protein
MAVVVIPKAATIGVYFIVFEYVHEHKAIPESIQIIGNKIVIKINISILSVKSFTVLQFIIKVLINSKID